MGINKTYLNLIKEMTVADFRTKHINTFLGYLWSLLSPLLLFGAMFLIFSVFLDWRSPDYTLYLLLGIILWTFFSETTAKGMTSIHTKAGLITKVWFPRSIIVFSSGLNAAITLLLNLCVFAAFFIFSSYSVGWSALLLPVIIVQLLFVSFGVSFGLSAFFLRFRDLSYIWQFALKIGFWLTPVVFPLAKIPEKYHPMLFINPLANIIKDARDVLIYQITPSISHILLITAISIIIFFIGYLLFLKMQKDFADHVVF